MRLSAWTTVLAVGGCATVAYFAVPGVAAKDLIYLAVGLAATGCLLAGIRRHRPIERGGWYLMALANACFVLGDGMLDYYDIVAHQTPPFPSLADGLYLAGYPFLFAGIFRVCRLRGRPGARESWADAAMICVGAMALCWQLLMGSYARDQSLSWFGRLFTMAYPVMDLGVLFIVVSAMMSGTARRTSDKLIGAAILSMLVADFGYDLLVLHGSYHVGSAVAIGYLGSYSLLAAAALHPSAAERLAGAGVRAEDPRRWLPLLAAATFVSPMILLVSSLTGQGVDVAVLALSTMLLCGLVAVRGGWLFGRLAEQTKQLATHGESLREALQAQQSLESDLRHLAFHDSLTGLANRALLHDRVEHALQASPRLSGSVALCFCDLDGFKAVNDSLGHQVGDELLGIVAKRLSAVVRAGDTVSRLGGDEFAVLLDNVDDPAVVTVLADRIVEVLRQPIRIDDERIFVSVSVGVAFAEPGSSTEQLLSEADSAMYEAKAAGKDRFVVFEEAMRSRIVNRLALLNSFQGSLERAEFFLEYQPQFRLDTGQLEGFEALVRWQHPVLGRIPPYSFIPVAEETGFIVTMGRWVLDMACLEAASWSSPTGDPLTLSVNLSARQLQDPGLIGEVRAALSLSGLSPRQLVLEITESVLMLDPDRIVGVLTELRAMGIRIAIDDFGTGYSSLSYLRQFPVDILKIDKSFIDPLNDPSGEGVAFVEAILRLGRDLHLRTIAEGIEHEAQRAALVRMHCDSAQGYLMSRPLSVTRTREFIDSVGDPSRLAPARPEPAGAGPGDLLRAEPAAGRPDLTSAVVH